MIVVVEGDGGVVHIPAPVLLPRQVVAQQAAVSLRGEDVVQPFEVGIVLLHPGAHSRPMLILRGSWLSLIRKDILSEMISQPRCR